MFKLQIKNVFVNEILGVSIDRELKFDKHVKHFREKGGNKLKVLTRMVKSFIKTQFNCFPLLWMFYSRSSSIYIHTNTIIITLLTTRITINNLRNL